MAEPRSDLAGAHFALAASKPAYTTTPTGFVCAFVQVTDPNDTIRCTWNNKLGTPKYSVDTLANYELFAGGTLSIDLDLDAIVAPALTTTIDFALGPFPTDPNLDTNTHTHVSVVLRVKGLNPPLKGRSQNNVFSLTVTCTVATATCA